MRLGGWLSPREQKLPHFHYVCRVDAVVLGASLKKALVAFPQLAPILYHDLDIWLRSQRLKISRVD